MKNKNVRIKKVTASAILLTASIITVYGFLMILIDELPNLLYKSLAVLLCIIITFVIIFCKKEKIFNWLFNLSWKPDIDDQKILGRWNLFIYFDKKEEFDRNGELEITDTYAGLNIIGEKLCDHKGNTTVEKWFAHEAEFYHFADKSILIYQYWLQDDEDSIQLSKLGIVIATSTDMQRCEFKGTFKDFKIEDGEISREGTVTLRKKVIN